MIIRNFMTTLRRFKMASGLNIVGLSIAFAAFVLILMQVSYENGFDKGYPQQVYRVETLEENSTNHFPWYSRPVARLLSEGSPAIQASTFSEPSRGDFVTVEKDGVRVGYRESMQNVSSGDGAVFGYEIVEGTLAAFEERKLVIPQSIARKWFGTESAVGRVVTLENSRNEDGTPDTREIGAVYRDFPANSSVDNSIKIPFDQWAADGWWGNWNYYMYVTLYPGADPQEAARQMNETYRQAEKPDWIDRDQNIRLQPIEEVYYDMTADRDLAPKGNRATINLLLGIALLVIGIAAVNFVNFAMSLAPLRIKNINTRKVLGSSVAALRIELICESVGIALLGFALGLGWVYLLRDTSFNALISGGISFSTYSEVIWLGAAVALGVGLLAGSYPAAYTTSFPPALVLKGSFGLSPKGRKLRTALIGFQFVVSLGLIVAAMFMQLQNNFMRDISVGYDKEQVALVDLSQTLSNPDRTPMLVNQLKADANIEDVAFALATVGAGDTYMGWGRKTHEGEDLNFECFPVSWNFCRVMGIEVIEGRDFTEEDQARDGIFIFNETAMKRFNLTLDDRVQGHRNEMVPIAGVARDFNYASLRNPIGPMCLYQFGTDPWRNLDVAYIKIKGNPFAAADHIKKTLAELDPLYPVEITFYDELFNNLYQKERKTTALITTFSLLAVALSLMGVFGLVLFETQYRRKEIGVRKVLGATVAEVLGMFNRSFVRLVLICFVVAAPLAWYGVREWLAMFAYRTPIYWWVFAASLAIVLFITLLTVTVQSWRAATDNPVRSLRAE